MTTDKNGIKIRPSVESLIELCEEAIGSIDQVITPALLALQHLEELKAGLEFEAQDRHNFLDSLTRMENTVL